MKKNSINWSKMLTVQDLIDLLSLYPKNDKIIFIESYGIISKLNKIRRCTEGDSGFPADIVEIDLTEIDEEDYWDD